MFIGLTVLAIYFIIMISLDFFPFKKNRACGVPAASVRSDESFFLSDRKMNTAVLLISTAATNFSAFTILGLSGAGYRIGYAFYPVMAFGTGFMALGMYLIGAPLGEFGKERNYVSPADFIADRYGSPVLTKVYAVLLVLLTLPYLALQPIAAGILLETTFGVPYRIGVVICLIAVGLYTSRGGMRAVVRTDLLQGVIIVVLATAAYLSVVKWRGGFAATHSEIMLNAPEVLDRFGRNGTFGPAVLTGYIVLWFFADPMFPQLNQRFLAANNIGSLKKTVILYPIVTMILFFLTISVGVIGAGVLPELGFDQADRIWPVMILKSTGKVLLPVFMIAPLAAIMSTLDSQLLSLSSIITRDLAGKRDMGERNNRIATAVIAGAGLAIALFPPGNILEFINKSSFLGYAALAPLVFGGLYGRRFNLYGGFASIIAGEGLTLLLGLDLIDFGAVPDVFIVVTASWLALYAGSGLQGCLPLPGVPAESGKTSLPVKDLRDQLTPGWALIFGILFLLGCDFITYFIVPAIRPGAEKTGFNLFVPGWLLYQAALCAILSLCFYIFFRRRSPVDERQGKKRMKCH